jgi:hypothetical protein
VCVDGGRVLTYLLRVVICRADATARTCAPDSCGRGAMCAGGGFELADVLHVVMCKASATEAPPLAQRVRVTWCSVCDSFTKVDMLINR